MSYCVAFINDNNQKEPISIKYYFSIDLLKCSIYLVASLLRCMQF